MGVSIDVYRSCIGTFNVRSSRKRRNGPSTSTYPSSTQIKSVSKYLIILLGPCGLLVVLLISSQLLQSCSRVFPVKRSNEMFTALPPWPTPTPPAWLPPWPPPWPPPLPTPFSRLSDYCCRTLSLKSYHLSGKELNFLARMINGNRKQRGHRIKLLHWNKGPSFLHNKHSRIHS